MHAGTPPFDGPSELAILASVRRAKVDLSALHVSPHALHFLQHTLVRAPSQRLTAAQALVHPWVAGNEAGAGRPSALPTSVLASLRRFAGFGVLKVRL